MRGSSTTTGLLAGGGSGSNIDFSGGSVEYKKVRQWGMLLLQQHLTSSSSMNSEHLLPMTAFFVHGQFYAESALRIA